MDEKEIQVRGEDPFIKPLQEAIHSKDEEIRHLEDALRQRESQIVERDKTIRSLERVLHQKDLYISKQRKEVLRLRGIEKTLAWRGVRRVFDLVEGVLLPPRTRRGQLFLWMVTRITGNLEDLSRSEKESNHHASGDPFSEEVIEPVIPRPIKGLDFPAFHQPRVSIIIPAWNKFAYTYRCLMSILENTAGTPYEVILVDNDSTDETKMISEKVRNITLVRNESNLGFLRASNIGAGHARGEYLLFLNNDTEVKEGWLKAMVGLTDADQTIGAVGPKLISPDGLLQEAGAIIWDEGSVTRYGEGEDPDSPQFCYKRDVNYCSGACLLVRKRLFDDLGGFDEVYSPAYYEDADMCLGVKRLGYRVVYQPEAKVLHHEYGSGTRERAKHLYLSHRFKFMKKWAPVLKKHLQSTPGNVLRAREARAGKRMLVIDDIVPASYLGSGYPRTNMILRYLAESGYLITFFPLADGFAYQPDTKVLQKMGIEVFYGEELNLLRHLRERRGFYDLVLICRPHNAARVIKYLKAYCPGAFIVYDAEALYSLREIEGLKLKGLDVNDRKEMEMIGQELEPAKYADAIMVVSEYEKKKIEARGYANLFVWGYPLKSVSPEGRFEERRDLLFVGGFLESPSPNEDAMLHFTRNIFPPIQERLECRLFIAGTNYLDSIQALQSDSVTVTGFVEDLKEYYERSRVFVVPTRFGAGISLKLLEAMAHGVPSVVTPLIARQLDLTEGQGILIGKDDQDFSSKIIDLYHNRELWYALQREALDFTRSRFDPEEMKLRLATFFRSFDSSRQR